MKDIEAVAAEFRIHVLEMMVADLMARRFVTEGEMRMWTEKAARGVSTATDKRENLTGATYQRAWDAMLARVREQFAFLHGGRGG